VARRVKQEAGIVRVLQTAAKKPAGGTSLLHDKVYGNILAGAIGNAMGSPVEGQFYWEIDQKHPGGIRTVLEPGRLESEDDNQMAMLLTETYLQRGGTAVMGRHFGETWRQRLNRDHFFVLCMGNAYDLIRQGWDPRITGHWSVVTGSTVMCMEPVGIYNLADPDWAFQDAMAVSYMYQRGLDLWAAASMAATVAEALRPEATVDSVCQAALDTAPRTQMQTFDRRTFRTFREYLEACLQVAAKYDDVLAARKELYDKCLLYHHIDPLELWGFSLAMFKIANGDVRQAAIGGTNIGRDSDTIAGRAAMLAGTLRGGHTVPKEWVRMFRPDSLRRIRTNAGRFADLLTHGKLATLKARQRAVSGSFTPLPPRQDLLQALP
jgi:ADP-ribosylglycohydrolase